MLNWYPPVNVSTTDSTYSQQGMADFWFLSVMGRGEAQGAVPYSIKGWASHIRTGVSMSRSDLQGSAHPQLQKRLLWGLGSHAPALPGPMCGASHLCLPQACTLARRNAEVFLKYIHRNNVSMPSAASHTRGPEQQVKGQCETSWPWATPAAWTRGCVPGLHATSDFLGFLFG